MSRPFRFGKYVFTKLSNQARYVVFVVYYPLAKEFLMCINFDMDYCF